jgi:ATP synthase protein I
VTAVSANDSRDEPVELRLKDEQKPPVTGPGLAARRHQSWSSRFDRGQGENPAARPGSAGLGQGGEIVSYLVSGMLAYGGIGWLVGRAVHIELLFPLGLAVGLGLALWWVIYRYGRVGGARKQ